MKLILQSVLYCCLLATVAYSAKLEMKPEVRKRLTVWLTTRMRREINGVTTERIESEQFVRPKDVRDNLPLHPSTLINIRTKRSKPLVNQSRRPGCSLGTCTVHDLAHRLHQLNNKMKIGSAPIDKISPQGYGRKRRSLPEHRLRLRREQGRLRPVWSNTDS